MEFEIIHTERLSLRKLTPEVYEHLFENYHADEIIQMLGIDKAEYEKQLHRYNGGNRTFNRSFVYFQILKKNTNTVIGGCGFHTWAIDHCRAEIGYDLKNDSDKQLGLMTEAMQKIIPFGFHEMKLHRIEACVGLANIPSLKLLEKFGFLKEGILREHYLKNNIYQDSIILSLLKKDWANLL